MAQRTPIELLDDGMEWPRHRLLVIGCGNILRGDDAAGPVLVRRLWEREVLGSQVRLADGGTSGMNVAFEMRHADRVLIVDAAATGAKAGTVYRVPASEIAELPPVGSLGSHDFRWDHAVAVGRWLLGAQMPDEIDVYLIEGESYEFGRPLSDAVDRAVDRVSELVIEQAQALGV
ncbi:hydrogenase maturation protease [Gordonia sp. PP30]|uniref:hydrogenase maturation protease n=1 Tax=Gordonia sp. PP30 TaxID=2935861 RepID=UPI001FFFA8B4|nr:hydrogenase maturation protease [Gordonia sp. PP30]UQE76470.1 hydrogenase maturation protease [Gordonia sp. PP30]